MIRLLFQDKMYYSLIGDDKAQDFFYVDPTTGAVSLKKAINQDTSTQYDVSWSTN